MSLNVYVMSLNYLKVFGVDSRIKSSEKEKEIEIEKKNWNYRGVPNIFAFNLLECHESLATSHGHHT